ncbi:MAG: hypothetical protein Q8R79_08210 [Legionellaceae bacterium]|nr:hypothetical protein [Legionellaceae bacterium]
MLNSPLYKKYLLHDDIKVLSSIYGRGSLAPFDGHCSFCNKETTYNLSDTEYLPGGDPWDNIKKHIGFGSVAITCSRNKQHEIVFFFHLSDMQIQKVGQLPSLADIANDEIKKYRKYMTAQDGAEFYKAIGLAANGVGIGSFVYLRRTFERLIRSRFNELKNENSWDESSFNAKHMDEKIAFLNSHLPDFLVSNRKIYSILSKGMHELEEKECLAMFELLKISIIMILEEDKSKKEALALRKKLTESIAKIPLNQRNTSTTTA